MRGKVPRFIEYIWILWKY